MVEGKQSGTAYKLLGHRAGPLSIRCAANVKSSASTLMKPALNGSWPVTLRLDSNPFEAAMSPMICLWAKNLLLSHARMRSSSESGRQKF